jgi:hypothetical protein
VAQQLGLGGARLLSKEQRNQNQKEGKIPNIKTEN